MGSRAYSDTGTWMSEDVFNLLAIKGPHAMSVCQESNPDLPIHSPIRYPYTPRTDGSGISDRTVTKDEIVQVIYLIEAHNWFLSVHGMDTSKYM